MPLFSTTNKASSATLRKMVNLTTILSPTDHGFHLQRNSPMPLINIINAEGATEPPSSSSSDPKALTCTSSNSYDIVISLAMQNRLKKVFDDLRSRRSSISRTPYITRDQFVVFLESTQSETNVEHILAEDKERYSLGEFLETWWRHFGWDACKPLKAEEKDLGRPLTNYFISSSHNTYLEGNQLASKSSPEAYKTNSVPQTRPFEKSLWLVLPERRRNHSRSVSAASRSLNPHDSTAALGPGASVESLDDTLRPSSHGKSRLPYPKDEPIVTHGWTLTTPCGFREVCIAVRESAFETNELPIIVSLEVHADAEQQGVMVRIMKEEWGEMLIDKSWEGIDPRFRLPKLEEMKKKILIKVKKAPHKIEVPPSTSSLSPVNANDEDASSSEDERNHAPQIPAIPAEQKNAKVAVCQALSSLAIYTHSEHFKSFETPAAKKPSHIFSISESKILELHTTKAREMFAHNKNFFMRAFPNGARVDSSNPDPSLFWRKGVQMVALNWQYLDEGMMLNEGMFAGELGWVLKPIGYRSSDKDTSTEVDAAPQGDLDLTVSIIAGQHVWDASSSESDSNRSGNSLRPFVKCELHVEIGAIDGKAADEDDFKLKTASKKTDHPEWESGGRLKFPRISRVVEELSFLRFKVEDDPHFGGDELLSWACIRLDRLRSGYRFVRLMDTKGRPIEGGKLLVKIDKVVR
ncbi:1-phosphatidylinositol 4,5-bisphosphate phosphodiesterase delta-3 [Colletotrichum trifolii]|uniref:Phosphoinositide phospholipase C n=1 Tax=Colletotrichum trifolii TaxID=5466 RepID=A0A4R8R620_COLTR|nr:1-phosphatidylinositol 4,5-bisphosphate phosphodiesterase delta-3 [Colletotrichum trifolii]